MKFKSTMLAILSAIGFGQVGSEEESPVVTEERLELLNSKLEAANQTISSNETEINSLKEELNTTKSNLTRAEQERDEAKAKAEELGKRAGASHAAPLKDKVEGGNTEAEDISAEIANLEHNKALDQNPLFN